MTIGRGQLVTSRGQLSEETGLSQMQVRTTMDKLQHSGFITKSATSKYTTVTICNYDSYQQQQDGCADGCQPADNQQITSEQPTDNQPITTTKESKKERKEEYSTHTVVSEKGVVGGNAAELVAWINENVPTIASMPEPFNETQLSWMLARYEMEDIRRIIRDMDNKGATKNKSAYSTFSAFAGRDTIIKERGARKERLYTYEEMCNEIPSRAKMEDFERVEINGRAMWRKRLNR